MDRGVNEGQIVADFREEIRGATDATPLEAKTYPQRDDNSTD